MSDQPRPIPKALYPCHCCYEEYSWPARYLYWSDYDKGWVCGQCWNDRDPSCEETFGPSLAEEIAAQTLGHVTTPPPPIPTPIYPCRYCFEERSWPATDLWWSERDQDWVCALCWDDRWGRDEERGPTLAQEIAAQAAARS